MAAEALLPWVPANEVAHLSMENPAHYKMEINSSGQAPSPNHWTKVENFARPVADIE